MNYQNIIQVNFSQGNNEITSSSVYQYDKGVQLKVRGIQLPDDWATNEASVQAHFTYQGLSASLLCYANRIHLDDGTAQIPENGILTFDVPNAVLQNPYNITCYLYIYNKQSDSQITGKTIKKITIPLIAREQAQDSLFTDVEAHKAINVLGEVEAMKTSFSSALTEVNNVTNDTRQFLNDAQQFLSNAEQFLENSEQQMQNVANTMEEYSDYMQNEVVPSVQQCKDIIQSWSKEDGYQSNIVDIIDSWNDSTSGYEKQINDKLDEMQAGNQEMDQRIETFDNQIYAKWVGNGSEDDPGYESQIIQAIADAEQAKNNADRAEAAAQQMLEIDTSIKQTQENVTDTLEDIQNTYSNVLNTVDLVDNMTTDAEWVDMQTFNASQPKATIETVNDSDGTSHYNISFKVPYGSNVVQAGSIPYMREGISANNVGDAIEELAYRIVDGKTDIVQTINGTGPDENGNIDIGTVKIDGETTLSEAIANAGSVKKVNGQEPVNGQITINASDITLDDSDGSKTIFEMLNNNVGHVMYDDEVQPQQITFMAVAPPTEIEQSKNMYLSSDGSWKEQRTIGNGLTIQDNNVSVNVGNGIEIDSTGKINAVYNNPNLFDNPFFTIDQRGGNYTAVSSACYTYDRWYLSPAGASVQKANEVVTVSGTSSSGGFFSQYLERERLSAGSYTLSIMLSDGTVKSATGTIPSTLPSTQTDYIKVNTGVSNIASCLLRWQTDGKWRFMFATTAGKSVGVRAFKLEKGTISTLANDAPPNYAEELLKCQRYFVRIKTTGHLNGAGFFNTSTTAYVHIALPTVMRTTASVSVNGNMHLWYTGKIGSSSLLTSAVSGEHYNMACALYLTCTVSGATAGNFTLPTFRDANFYIDLVADL